MSFHEIFSFSLLAFTSIFFIVNPIGAVPVFLSLTDGWKHPDRVRASKRANLLACAVLLVFTISGSLIFRLFGVTLGAFRIAGGILLMRVALDMLQGRKPETKATAEDKADAFEKEDIAITPIGVPELAGPGSIATVILLPGEPRELWRLGPIIIAIIVTIVLSYFILREADRVIRLIGKTGMRIMSKIMGLLVAAVAVEFVSSGVRDLIPSVLEKIT